MLRHSDRSIGHQFGDMDWTGGIAEDTQRSYIPVRQKRCSPYSDNRSERDRFLAAQHSNLLGGVRTFAKRGTK